MRDDLLVMKGHKCGYCLKPSVAVSKAEYFNKPGEKGYVYACLGCRAHVGVYKNADKPLGRLAKAELRILKMQAHHYFDSIWLVFKVMYRTDAYAWLGEKMNLHPEAVHIGMFNEEQCLECIQICKDFILNEIGLKELFLSTKSF